MRPAPFSSSKNPRRVKVTPTAGAILDEFIDEGLAGDIARAVARLTQVELLFEAEQIQVRPHPPSGRPFDLKRLGLLDVELVRLRVERGQAAAHLWASMIHAISRARGLSS